ncbi:GlxA family transcriptional regulator [Flavobacterium terrisoli]|uniref:GlxA family transcriptional regulator n=1 Tax=Flavobacterium terrisoli TaxID=3242195 RepID=UPI002542DF80|nr:helix-turn-helix domain-containing protein [Flavobacterium buctense]
MKHLSILVPVGHSKISSIVCTYKVFTYANAYWKGIHGEDLLKIQLVGISDAVEFYEGIFTIKPHTNIERVTKTDLIIIGALDNRDYQYSIQQNQPIIDWMAKQYKEGAEVASMCTGAFLLASSGLLDGRRCSTHWAADNTFRAMFPKVNLQTDKLITDENGIYTNGGAFSFLNLIVYLIEKYFDRQTAIYCAKLCQIEMDRNSQSPFIIFTGQKQHGDEMVQQAQTFIENNLHEKISVEHLADKFSVGRRNFDRRFIKATGNTPVEYSQRVKIESAKKAFETTRKTINEVMYEVGYSDIKAFREVFRKITGMSPVEYRGKYNKEAVV